MAGNNKDIEADALDDLLNFDDVVEQVAAPEPAVETEQEDSAPVVQEAPAVPESTPELDEAAAEIARLKAELARARTRPTDEFGRPLAEGQLTPQQREIRVLDDAVAKKRATDLDTAPETYEAAEGDSILIHFVEDGFTAQGRIWYRGQELEFALGGEAYEQTKNRYGVSWLDMTEDEQLDRYNTVYFRRGPWRGKDWDLAEAATAERKRNRAAPVVTV